MVLRAACVALAKSPTVSEYDKLDGNHSPGLLTMIEGLASTLGSNSFFFPFPLCAPVLETTLGPSKHFATNPSHHLLQPLRKQCLETLPTFAAGLLGPGTTLTDPR